MLARHEETRAMRFDNTKSLAFGLRTLLAVALHQYVEEHVDSDSQSCPQSTQLKLYQKRMAGVGKQAEGCDCEPCFLKQILTKISISPARNNGKKTTQWNYGEKTTKIMLHMSQNLNGNHFWIIQVSDESQYRHVRFPAWRVIYDILMLERFNFHPLVNHWPCCPHCFAP